VERGLTDDLVHGQLAPPGVLPAGHLLPGLNPEQRQAYAACRSSGLHLVWGPPGTGKTRVLAMAIGDLLADGLRVLLVSSTNIAVDNALLETLRIRRLGPGVAVRVGPPQIPEVARNEEVNLPLLASQGTAELTEQRKRLERELIELTAPAQELALVEQRLQGFDKDGYQRAVVLDQNEKRRETAAHSLAVAQHTAHRVAAEHDQAQEELCARRQQRAGLQPSADLLAKATQLQGQLDAVKAHHQQIELAWQAAVGELCAYEAKAAEVGAPPWWRRSAVRDLQQQRAQLELNADKKKGDWDSSKDVVRKEDAALTPQIQQLRKQAAPVDEQKLKTSDRECEEASTRHAQSGDRLAKANAAVQQATTELREAEDLPRLDDEHRRLLADARSRDVPTLLLRHEELRSSVTASTAKIRDLEQQQEKVLTDLDRFRRSAETEIIRKARLVATTLARARAHRAVLRDGFDVVLIDEVGAALVPELLPAVAQAGRTAVLLGDFRQLGPILPSQLKAKRERSDVQKWLRRDAFAFCGITSPEMAQEHPGCVVLNQQYRFPPTITALANEVGYGGVLRDGAEPAESDKYPRIVLIDTDGLDDLAIVRRTGKFKGWWPAGALLTRVIAQHHRGDGKSVGVITPYASQAEATLEAIRDVEGVDNTLTEIAVGTAHRVQGRQFEVAVVDLVEDGRQEGWLANASLSSSDDWYREGARLFIVATTRPRRRLYLIGSWHAVRSAQKGTVLATVAAMVTNGRIHRLPATALISGSDGAPLDSPALAELASTLAQWVRVVELHDETTFFAALVDELDRADESIWLWAPWTGARMLTLLDTLAVAVQRGVRVVTFVRGVKDQMQGRPAFQSNAAALRAIGVHVIEYHDMHQKIVVIDRCTTMIGSLNTLSHNRTREVMVVHNGRMFAERLLQHEYADELSKVPRCAQCGSTPEVRRYKSSPPLRWYCTACRWSKAIKLSKGNARPSS
jgi:molybdopterin-guanine dinucleotide biosynthesis protein